MLKDIKLMIEFIKNISTTIYGKEVFSMIMKKIDGILESIVDMSSLKKYLSGQKNKYILLYPNLQNISVPNVVSVGDI